MMMAGTTREAATRHHSTRGGHCPSLQSHAEPTEVGSPEAVEPPVLHPVVLQNHPTHCHHHHHHHHAAVAVAVGEVIDVVVSDEASSSSLISPVVRLGSTHLHPVEDVRSEVQLAMRRELRASGLPQNQAHSSATMVTMMRTRMRTRLMMMLLMMMMMRRMRTMKKIMRRRTTMTKMKSVARLERRVDPRGRLLERLTTMRLCRRRRRPGRLLRAGTGHPLADPIQRYACLPLLCVALHSTTDLTEGHGLPSTCRRLTAHLEVDQHLWDRWQPSDSPPKRPPVLQVAASHVRCLSGFQLRRLEAGQAAGG